VDLDLLSGGDFKNRQLAQDDATESVGQSLAMQEQHFWTSHIRLGYAISCREGRG
jgi:hypothetical protein